jgi:hypothetical protein
LKKVILSHAEGIILGEKPFKPATKGMSNKVGYTSIKVKRTIGHATKKMFTKQQLNN